VRCKQATSHRDVWVHHHTSILISRFASRIAKKIGNDGPLQGNTYNIYAQDIPEIDMYTHLPRWITYLEGCLGRALQPGDYILCTQWHCASRPPDDTRHGAKPDQQICICGRSYTTHCLGGCPIPVHVCTNWQAMVPVQDTVVGRMGIRGRC